MRRRWWFTIVALGVAAGPAMAQQGVPIQVLASTFSCRDMSDMIRLGLRRLDGDKTGFLALYQTKQESGACVPLRAGTIAQLQDSHDEQGLHLVCIKQAEYPVCFWSVAPQFGPAP